MATGDIKNNLRKLQNELKLVHYTQEMDFKQMLIGLSAPFLPILHYVFTEYSCDLSSYFSIKGYDLYAKTDLRFLEVIYKVLVQEFGTKPMLTKQQFFAIGYSEMKVIFTTKIVSLCRQKNESIKTKLGKKKKKNLSESVKVSHNPNKQAEGLCNGDRQMRHLSDGDQRKESLDGYKCTATRNKSTDGVVNGRDGCKLKEKMVVESVEDDIVVDYTSSEYHINPPKPSAADLSSSGFHIKPPQPNPELALTPIKESNGKSLAATTEVECREIDSKLLDITDIGEDSFFETGGAIEISDSEEEMSASLPDFVITKHSGDIRKIEVNTHGQMLANEPGKCNKFKTYTEPLGNKQLPSGHSLPGNISVTSPQSNPVNYRESNRSKQNTRSQQCQQCEQCLVNSNSIKTLCDKIEAMKGEIANLVDVNNDLSAKVVLMETKIKILDTSMNKGGGNVNHEGGTVNTYKEVGNVEKSIIEEEDTISIHSNDSRVHGSDNSKLKNVEKQYSPIKYTDDDIIIKDFKPIRMKDVHSMMNEVDGNKENAGHAERETQPKKVKVRKETFKLKVLRESDSEDNTSRHLNHLHGDENCSSDALNVSNNFDDDLTKQTVRNVRKKLQETENMLKSNGNYIRK